MSAKKPALESAAPAVLPMAESMALGQKLLEVFEPTPDDIRELDGMPEFLEVLDSLNPIARARLGFKFTVLDYTRGQNGFIDDGEWGASVPTPAALALRYGPGTYRVRPKCSRKGKQGGGFSTEIVVHIVPARVPGGAAAACPHAAAPASSRDPDPRFVGRLFDLLEVKHERAAAASDAGIPKEMPAWLPQAVEAIQGGKEKMGDLPEWLRGPVETFLSRMVEGDDEKPEGAQP